MKVQLSELSESTLPQRPDHRSHILVSLAVGAPLLGPMCLGSEYYHILELGF